MSAYLCSSNHVAILAKYCFDNSIYLGERWDGTGTIHSDLIARALAKRNINSVINTVKNAKYDIADKMHIDECADVAATKNISGYSEIEIYKLAQCLGYNSDASDNWGASNEKKLIDRIKQTAIESIPGYSDAAWGIN